MQEHEEGPPYPEAEQYQPLGETVGDHFRRMFVLLSVLGGAWAALHLFFKLGPAEPFLTEWLRTSVSVIGAGILLAGFVAIGISWAGLPARLADIHAALELIEAQLQRAPTPAPEEHPDPAGESDVKPSSSEAIGSALPTHAALHSDVPSP
jgi:hypothetical protein